MRLSKFLSIAIFITFFSLLYVWQQTEVFRLAYVGQKKQVLSQELLDKNSILRYNIKRNASLVAIGNRILGSADFQMPDTYQLVRLAPGSTGLKLKEQLSSKGTLISRLFGIKRQAEAKTINR